MGVQNQDLKYHAGNSSSKINGHHKLNLTKLRNLEVHGDCLHKKQHNSIRIMYEQVDGLAINSKKKQKIKKLRTLLKDLEVDIYGAAEVNVNWSRIHNNHKLQQLMKTETDLSSITAHNENENFRRYQIGGTAMLAIDSLATQVHVKGRDSSKLGRWCWMSFRNTDLTETIIITAYCPNRSRKQQLTTAYAQQRRFWTSKGQVRNPRQLFREDLCKLIGKWIEQGKKVILLVDGNEDQHNGKLARSLQTLGMNDAVKARGYGQGPATWTRGTKQIDAIWTTDDIPIEGARFLPFHLGIGDHRPIIIDIPTTSLTGQNTKIIHPQARRLQLKIPKSVYNYQRTLNKFFNSHPIEHKLEQLANIAKYPLKETHQKYLEGIDELKTRGMKHAEKHCRKLRMGTLDFSPELDILGRRAQLWDLVIKKLTTGKVRTKTITRKARACGVINPLGATIQEANRAAKLAWEEYNKSKPHSRRLRDLYLQSKSQSVDKETCNKILSQIRRENDRTSWRRIGYIMRKKKGGCVSQIEENTSEGWVTRKRRHDIERAIMENNTKRFRLTEQTELMQPPMLQELGYHANTQAGKEILSGSYQPPLDTGVHVQGILPLLKTKTNKKVNTIIKRKDFQNYWRKAKEKTSSSFSGLHFGHYKVAAKTVRYSDFHSKLINIAFNTGYPLQRWRKGLTVMLEKKLGSHKVDSLRAILLMEADFNFGNKLIFGSRMVKAAESQHLLPKDNYGSRPKHDSASVGLNRKLTFDLIRQRKVNSCVAGADAAQCYDRIVHSFTSMACQSLGVNLPPILTMLTAIQLMSFYIRTSFGESKSSYGGTKESPFQGLCQGNGAAPAVWLAVSSILVLYLYENDQATELHSAITLSRLIFIAFLFVDDADIPKIGTITSTPIDVTTKLQTTIDLWQGALRTSGGDLKAEKTYWYLIEFMWKNGRAHYTDENLSHCKLTILDKDTRVEVKRHASTISTEAVGMWQNPQGTMDDQVKAMCTKASDWGKHLISSNLSRRETWMAVKQVAWASQRYPLTATTLTWEESSLIMSKLLCSALPKMGINRNMARLICHAPTKYFGLDIPHPYNEQGIAHITTFLKHVDSNSLTGDMIRASMEQLQLELGSSIHPFQLNYSKWGFLATQSWISHLWKFLSENSIILENKDAPVLLPTRRQHDFHLMDRVIHLNVDRDQILSFNHVRMHLEAITMADLATGSGHRIRNSLAQGNKDDSQPSRLSWPVTKPTAADKRIWTSLLKAISCGTFSIEPRLGKWINEPHQHWRWFIDKSTGILYEKRNDTLSPHTTDQHQIQEITDDKLASKESTSPNVCRTTVCITRRGRVHEGCGDTLTTLDINHTTVLSWYEKWKVSQLLDNCNIIGSIEGLSESLKAGKLVAVCDGSYFPDLDRNYGAASWVLESDNQENRLIGGDCTPFGKMTPFRSELFGIYNCILITHAIELSLKVQGTIMIYCDNIEALRKSSGQGNNATNMCSCHDLIKAIKNIRSRIHSQVLFSHVRGHQDRQTSYKSLPRPAQLNIKVDKASKEILMRSYEDSRQPIRDIPFQGWYCKIGTHKISEHPHDTILDHIFKKSMRTYFLDKKIVKGEAFNHIDWDCIGDTLHSTPHGFKIWAIKHVTSQCATAHRMHQRGQWPQETCPVCGKQKETSTKHLLHCPHKQMEEARFKGWTETMVWLQESHCDPRFQHLLQELKEAQLDQSTMLYPELSLLQLEMVEIGFYGMMCGFLPKCLEKIQHDHLIHSNSRANGKSWCRTLCYKLLQWSHNLWTQRNQIIYEATSSGLLKADEIILKRDMSKLFRKLSTREDLILEWGHLFYKEFALLWDKPLEDKRAWICEAWLALGNTAKMKEESSNPRTSKTPFLQHVHSTNCLQTDTNNSSTDRSNTPNNKTTRKQSRDTTSSTTSPPKRSRKLSSRTVNGKPGKHHYQKNRITQTLAIDILSNTDDSPSSSELLIRDKMTTHDIHKGEAKKKRKRNEAMVRTKDKQNNEKQQDNTILINTASVKSNCVSRKQRIIRNRKALV